MHIRHCSVVPGSPLRPELPGNRFKPEVEPREDEPVFEKSVNSAFVGTGLDEALRGRGIEDVVIVGLTTDHCVSATTRSASDLGFTTWLVSDATATFDRAGPDGTMHRAEDIHAIHVASLHGEFCSAVTTDAVLAAPPPEADG